MSFLRRGSSAKKPRQRVTSTGKLFPARTTSNTELRRISFTSTSSGEDIQRWDDTVSPRLMASLSTREQQRQRVIFEVIKTERDYLRDLCVVRDIFRERLVVSKCVTDDVLASLFSNLDDVIATNQELYERFTALPYNGIVTGCVANVFVDLFRRKRFHPYVEFCANQLPASEQHAHLMQHGVNAHYVEVMTHCSGDAATRGFDLPAYLLKGMQRLLKYHPLLQQVKKRTAEDCHDAHAMLDEAMRLVEQHGLVVNEQVRARENARRLPQIQRLLVKEPTMKLLLGRKEVDVDLNLCADPERQLVHEGRLKHVKAAGVGGAGARTTDMYVVLLTDLLLLTTERDDGRYSVREGRDPPPIIALKAITALRAEATLPERARTTLCIEVGEDVAHEEQYDFAAGRDTPRPTKPAVHKTFVRLLAPTQGQLQTWMQTIKGARQAHVEQHHELMRTQSHTDSLHDEYAVTMLVSTPTRTGPSAAVAVADASGAPYPTAAPGDGCFDWEIDFSDELLGGAAAGLSSPSRATRSVRLVKGGEGLGFTIIGRSPVVFQEVDHGGPAWRAGIRPGDQIRAVNGVECTNAAHHAVTALIQDALARPAERAWIPVPMPLNDVVEDDAESLGSLGRVARSLRKALLTDPQERP